jgi:hypothetical protein
MKYIYVKRSITRIFITTIILLNLNDSFIPKTSTVVIRATMNTEGKFCIVRSNPFTLKSKGSAAEFGWYHKPKSLRKLTTYPDQYSDQRFS